MTAGWTSKALEEVCDFQSGLWKGEKGPFVTVGVIRNTNFTKEGSLDDSDIAYLDVEAKKFEKRRLQYGDIILEKSGGGPKQPVGRVVLFDKHEGKFSFSNFTSALRVRDPNVLDFRYLHKYLHWIYLSGVTEQMQSHSTGIRNLDGNAYKAVEVTFPSVAEQQRIVGILDEAFAGIATAKGNAEKSLLNACAIFGCYVAAALTPAGAGWSSTKLGQLVSFRNGVNFTKSSRGERLRILGVKDFQNYFWAPDEGLDYVTLDGAVADEDCLQKDDVVFVRSNGNPALIGRCVLVGRLSEKTTHSGFTIRARPTVSAVLPAYLCHVLKSGVLRKEMVEGGNGANIKSLSQRTLSRLTVSYPSVDGQLRIISDLEQVQAETRRLESIYQRKLAALDELKQSLLHRAFSGQL